MAGWIFQPLPAAGQEDAAAAGSAPGWDTQPRMVSRAGAIARATAAAVVVAGIDAVFVPPVVTTPAWGFESQPVVVKVKTQARAPQESVPLAARRVASGFESQPTRVGKRGALSRPSEAWFSGKSVPAGFEAQPQRVTARPSVRSVTESWPIDVPAIAQATYTFHAEQPPLVVWRSKASQVSDGWPVDAIQVAQQAPSWGFEAQPSKVTRRPSVLGVEPQSLVSVARPWGFEGQPPSALSRKVRIGQVNESGPLDVTVAAVVTPQWGFDGQPLAIRARMFAPQIGEGWPLDVVPVVIVEPPAPQPPPSGGSIRAGRSSGRWVRISDGSEIHLRVDDATVYVHADRVAVGVEELQSCVTVAVDLVSVGGLAELGAADSDTHVAADLVALGRDDLPEVLRLVRMAGAPKAPPASADVRGIWALIDAMRGKRKS